MNLIHSLPLALANPDPAVQTLALFFMGWTLVMFLVLHLDGTRAK